MFGDDFIVEFLESSVGSRCYLRLTGDVCSVCTLIDSIDHRGEYVLLR